MSLESKLANLMGYEYCELFPNARTAIARFVARGHNIQIPSNCCPVLATATMHNRVYPNFVAVDSHTGLAPGVPVQLYGYRQIVNNAFLEIDPHMTGYFGKPFAPNAIVSFGRNKMLDINGGGAFLTNDQSMLQTKPYFPEGLREPLEEGLDTFYDNVMWARDIAHSWDSYLGDTLERIPLEQVVPWRVMRRVPDGKRLDVVLALRAAGIDAGTNYPQLDGLHFESGDQWGDEVINLWTTPRYDNIELIKTTCGIIEQTVWDND